jgi:hypothetical protein
MYFFIDEELRERVILKYKNVKKLTYEIAKYYMTGHSIAERNLIRFFKKFLLID